MVDMVEKRVGWWFSMLDRLLYTSDQYVSRLDRNLRTNCGFGKGGLERGLDSIQDQLLFEIGVCYCCSSKLF